MVESSLQLLNRSARAHWPACTVVVNADCVHISDKDGILLYCRGVGELTPLQVALLVFSR